MLPRRAFLLTATAWAQRGQRPPNIVFIMADDLGLGDLGCYGQKIIRTPNIDRLAREGVRFTQAYSGCTVCAPSRSVLMTGMHMGHTSIRANAGGQSLEARDVTVAQLLQRAGYATGGFGKWGLGDLGTEGAPWKKGFDQFFGYLHQVHAHFFYPRFLLDNEKRYPLAGNENGQRTTYSHDVIANKALDFIEKNQTKPFFCYVPFTIPHWELLVPEDSLAEYRGKCGTETPFVQGHYAPQTEPRAAYAGMITRMDRDIGRILALLERLKLEQNTVVIFTSDNGASELAARDNYFHSTGDLRGQKGNVYEGGIRTPFVARWPGQFPAGRTCDLPVSFCDMLPTLCELAGVRAPAVDGRSIVPSLRGKTQKAPAYQYWELPRYIGKEQRFADELPMQALRAGDWKILRPKGAGNLELYNLKADPKETQDLAKSRPAEFRRLSALLAAARTPPRPLENSGQAYWDER
ncbi:MAG: arylsulfatase [Bryobacteraceae bacterium]|nr:arylsulfatase [Bryobacteraceae bacterium]